MSVQKPTSTDQANSDDYNKSVTILTHKLNRLDDFTRLTALYRLLLLDSPPEEAFDRVTRLLVKLINAPVALISLLDTDRQFFKSAVGLPEPWASMRETPLSHSFCQHVVTSGKPLIIDDARTNPLVADNLAIRDLGVIAYAGVPLKTESGDVLGSLCMIDSVPRVWQADELSTLEDLAAMLMTEIALRGQLIEADKQNQDLNAFANMAAHDLKAPLHLINGYAQLAQIDLIEQPDLHDYLQRIEWGSNKMSNIINDLLLLARVSETGVQMHVFDMAAIITDVQKRLADLFEQYHPVFKVPTAWPAVIGYPAWVEELWANYISNAFKYGGRPVQIELGATIQDNGAVRFWVADNGAGISPEQQVELFKPFTRFSANKDDVDGHGLGLSIVQRIAEKLGGTVSVESEVGKGSIFSFTLPLAPS
jgi:hypothetical protein